MNYTERYQELNALFRLGINTHLETTGIDIRFFSFKSATHSADNEQTIIISQDEKINENFSFIYPVFVPSGMKTAKQAILLLHGLNERNWSKYLTWAEYLCSNTGKPVILFPIAYHINRSPQSWSNPRDVSSLLNMRRQRYGEDRNLSFANVTFSERITENPYRFYSSGRQTINDLSQLFEQIKTGSHTLFAENTQIDIFAYSIGAFLSEITLMTNPKNLFSDSKLFLFCGGGIFSSMFGQSRSIMDKAAYDKLYEYYLNEFTIETISKSTQDKIFESFNSMISPNRNKVERETFFSRLSNKVMGIPLLNDKVMPFSGMLEAVGKKCFESRFKLLDFSFPYTHENPFPTDCKLNSREVDDSFNCVFSTATGFLS